MSDNKSEFSDVKFQKTFALTDSDQAGEALNAFRMSKAYLKRYGLTFQKYFQKQEEANILIQNTSRISEENAKLESRISDFENQIRLIQKEIERKRAVKQAAQNASAAAQTARSSGGGTPSRSSQSSRQTQNTVKPKPSPPSRPTVVRRKGGTWKWVGGGITAVFMLTAILENKGTNSANLTQAASGNTEEKSATLDSTENTYGGVGIVFSKSDVLLQITSTINGSPAQRVGLKSGDIILSVDQYSVEDIGHEKAIEKIKGRIGDTVTLSIRREGLSSPINFVVKREAIKIPPSIQESYNEPFKGVVNQSSAETLVSNEDTATSSSPSDRDKEVKNNVDDVEQNITVLPDKEDTPVDSNTAENDEQEYVRNDLNANEIETSSDRQVNYTKDSIYATKFSTRITDDWNRTIAYLPSGTCLILGDLSNNSRKVRATVRYENGDIAHVGWIERNSYKYSGNCAIPNPN